MLPIYVSLGAVLFLMFVGFLAVWLKGQAERRAKRPAIATPSVATAPLPPVPTVTAPSNLPAPAPVAKKEKPKKKDYLPWDGIVLLLGALAIVMYGIYAIATFGASNKPAPVATKEVRWSEVKTFRLTEDPVRIPTEKKAIGYEYHLVPLDLSRCFQLKNGGSKWHSLRETDTGPWVNVLEPCYLRIADGGPPLEVTWRWKVKE